MRLERTLNMHFYVLLKNGGSRALFTGPASTEFKKKIKIKIKLGPTVLFTHLKIILLQCF